MERAFLASLVYLGSARAFVQNCAAHTTSNVIKRAALPTTLYTHLSTTHSGRPQTTRMGVGVSSKVWYYPKELTARWAGCPRRGRPHLLIHGGTHMPRGKDRAATSADTSRPRKTGVRRASPVPRGWCILKVTGFYRPGLVVLTLRPWWKPSVPGVMVGFALFQTLRAARTGNTGSRPVRLRAVMSTGDRLIMRRRRPVGGAWRGNYILWTRAN